MPYYKFKKEDVFHNTIETHPHVKFDIHHNFVYLNDRNVHPGAHATNVGHVPTGCVNLFELNVDRPSDSLIYPFVTKEGSFEAVGNVSVKDYFSSFEYGDTITGSYPMSASLTRERFAASHGTNSSTGSHILALRNIMNDYTPMSPHYQFSSSMGNKTVQELSLLYIPSIFYGSAIKSGSVHLKFYISGTLVAEATDKYFNGELIQVSGTESSTRDGDVAGVVLYKEGVIVLTGSWDLTKDTMDFGTLTRRGQWIDFAAGANDGGNEVTPSASFSLDFEGINRIQTLTMFAHAPRSKMNYSTNPTFLDYNSYTSQTPITSSYHYKEKDKVEIYNTVSSSFYKQEDPFKHQTYISKVGIYDKNKNLIAVATMATPIRKTNLRDFTFKLKLDI